MDQLKRHDKGRPAIIVVLFSVLLALAAGGCGKQMARMEANQIKLQAMVMANARQLATVSSQVHVGQNELNSSLAQLDQKADGINSEVRTVQTMQTDLRQTMVNGNRQINTKLVQLEDNQAILKDGVAQVANITQNTNTAVGAVAKEQATLHRMVQNNKRELDNSFAAVVENQQRTHTGIDQLQQADRSLAGQITGVAQQQDAMQRLAQENNQQLVARLTTLDQGQAALRGDFANNTQTLSDKLSILEQNNLDIQTVIDRVANTTSATANDVTALAAAQAHMQETQGTHYESLTGQLAAVTQNQRGLQAGIGTLAQKADRTASQLTTLAAGQSSIQETMHANNTSINGSLANLADNQQTLSGDVQQLSKQSDALAADLRTGLTNQAAIQSTLAENSETFATFSENQMALQKRVSDLDGRTNAVAGHIASVVTELGAVRQDIRSGNEAMATQVTSLADGQQNLKTRVTQLSDQADQIVAGQATLRQTMQDQANVARGQMAELADDQQTIRDHVDAVMTTASQLALSLVTMNNSQTEFAQQVEAGFADLGREADRLAAGQDTLNGALENHSAALAGQFGQLAANQQTLQNNVEALTATANQIGHDLTSVGEGQDALRDTLQAHNDTITAGVAGLAKTQGQIQADLDAVTATTTQVALDVITLDDHQAKLELAAQAERGKLTARLDDVTRNQRQMQGGLDTLTATTTQVALDVIALDDNQSEQAKSLEVNHQAVIAKLIAAAEGQQQMQGNLDVITATTSQVGLDVIALDDKQGQIGQALQESQQRFGPRLTQLAENQQQLQTGLDVLTSTATQTALDVIRLDGNQARQNEAMETRQQELSTQLRVVSQGQQQMQGNLDTVTATTSQVALDVIALDDNQTKIEEAIQANRQELAGKLTEIAQGQQQWLARFDAAEAKVETMTDSIATLEQRVANLQGTLQASLKDLGTLLDAESQQRVQFQDSVRQDMQSVTDSVAQLREIQAGLAEHLQRVQDSTQSQNDEILSALEQLQRRKDASATDVDTELKSSMASPQEIRLP